MSANNFVLKHKNIESRYTIGVTPALPALIYKDRPEDKTFRSSEIATNETSLGSLVSVPLLRAVDTAGEMPGFFLPQPDTRSGQTENFSTISVFTKFGALASLPRLPPSWNCIGLYGTAPIVIMPLAQPVAKELDCSSRLHPSIVRGNSSL
ncbi:MAG: hypothetical protein ACJ72H_07400 [Candidatus Sulfotelmatobacter sp.]|jgi:hypothetical protein